MNLPQDRSFMSQPSRLDFFMVATSFITFITLNVNGIIISKQIQYHSHLSESRCSISPSCTRKETTRAMERRYEM